MVTEIPEEIVTVSVIIYGLPPIVHVWFELIIPLTKVCADKEPTEKISKAKKQTSFLLKLLLPECSNFVFMVLGFNLNVLTNTMVLIIRLGAYAKMQYQIYQIFDYMNNTIKLFNKFVFPYSTTNFPVPTRFPFSEIMR